MTRRMRALVAATTVLVALGSLAACGDDGGDEPTTDIGADDTSADGSAGSESTGEDESTSTTLSPEDQVWEHLNAGYTAVAELSAAPDPDAPELAKYHTGDALSGLQDTMRDLRAGGGAETTVTLHRYSVSVTGETATAEYCFVDTSQYLDTAGNPAGEPEVTSMRANAELQLIDGTWKMSQSTIEPERCPA